MFDLSLFNALSSQLSPESPQRSNSSELLTFPESIKSKFSAVSARYYGFNLFFLCNRFVLCMLRCSVIYAGIKIQSQKVHGVLKKNCLPTIVQLRISAEKFIAR